ncbi:MAG: LysR family transcriptional regulator [Bacteroidetes bacterium]|nr:LysR family transcriptional regulator [Bacteroidota bacterium]
MHYTLHQLQIFLKVVSTQSVTKASEELFMTQPAVSIQLKKLQEQFEVPLTEVIGRKIHITEFGIQLAKMAEKILNEVYAINYKTLAYKGVLAGKVKIASVSTGKYIMPYFISRFYKSNPGIDFVIDVTNKAKVIESLENNETDFALISTIPKNLKLEEEILLENKLYLIGNKDANKKNVTTKELNSLPYIFREDGSATRLAMEGYLDKQNISVRKKVELTSNEAVKQAVIAGLGYSIMPLIGIRNELKNKELYIIKSPNLPMKSNWRLVWLKKKELSHAAAAYLEYIKKEKQTILSTNFKWVTQFK